MASPPNPKIMGKYADLLGKLKRKGHELVVVVGGGALARDYIKVAEDMGLGESDQDEVAIWVSRLFAKLLALRLSDLALDRIPTSIDEAMKELKRGKVVVMGGIKPGMTTDAVAAMVAKGARAELLVKATDQDGVYTKDPKKYPLIAEKIDMLSFDELFELLDQNKHKAGIHQILDPKAVRLLRIGGIRTVVVNGFDPENVALAIRGEKIGTTIQ